MKEFLTLAILQVFVYGCCCFSYRAISRAAYRTSVGVDIVYASVNFWVIRRIATADSSVAGWLGYTVGSALGTVLGIWLSKVVLDPRGRTIRQRRGEDTMSSMETLRDQFAMAALTGILSSVPYSNMEHLSEVAYEYADEMMKAREVGGR